MRTETVLRYGGGLSGRPFGVRLWEVGREVRAAAFGGPRLASADTAARRSALRALAALAAAPPDTVPQESVGAGGTRVVALCADRISASVTVSGRAGVQAAPDARCRRSPAEVRFRRAVDSVFTSLAAWPLE